MTPEELQIRKQVYLEEAQQLLSDHLVVRQFQSLMSKAQRCEQQLAAMQAQQRGSDVVLDAATDASEEAESPPKFSP